MAGKKKKITERAGFVFVLIAILFALVSSDSFFSYDEADRISHGERIPFMFFNFFFLLGIFFFLSGKFKFHIFQIDEKDKKKALKIIAKRIGFVLGIMIVASGIVYFQPIIVIMAEVVFISVMCLFNKNKFIPEIDERGFGLISIVSLAISLHLSNHVVIAISALIIVFALFSLIIKKKAGNKMAFFIFLLFLLQYLYLLGFNLTRLFLMLKDIPLLSFDFALHSFSIGFMLIEGAVIAALIAFFFRGKKEPKAKWRKRVRETYSYMISRFKETQANIKDTLIFLGIIGLVLINSFFHWISIIYTIMIILTIKHLLLDRKADEESKTIKNISQKNKNT
jgi:hypothetical protein